ncbi:hypothetical protein LguiB_004029 [Lonicera macranthoides]
MEIDPSQSMKQKASALQTYASGPLPSSISKLSASSRGLPSDKDFHFYYNFDEFKLPIEEIAHKSQTVMNTIGNSAQLWGKEMSLPIDYDEDDDGAYDWLVNVNDEVFERFDVSVDEFKRLRKQEEETGVRVMSSMADSENGFQLVYGKKNKKKDGGVGAVAGGADNSGTSSAVKVASRDKKAMGTKPKVPFHIPTIPRPQDEFKILVNNSNQPFEHVWLQRSEDGSRFIHPLEKLSFLDFVDKNVGDIEPLKPSPLESTPFKLVEEVKDLKELAAKLRVADEFSVDLEHNHYRSFQGLTCLMQISTRTHDFVVDTLKLRIHIGPYLRDVFKDPTKKKVMHGSDRDIIWLQRDFGIYICNMFDTGQASRVLKMERNSLEYLLQHFCGVTANKEYQNADWRLRPLPAEMVRYAREDTHYLLYIYDLMRIRLLSSSTEPECSENPLEEVYKRSYDICMQLYEKEVLTENSYLYIYGVQCADLNAQQLSIVAGLSEWRDVVARAEDESTGYILPNKTLLEIAKQMPVTASKLRRLVMSKHPYIERNLGSVVSIIRHSIQNASAFEAVAEQLKEARVERATDGNAPKTENVGGSNLKNDTSFGSQFKQKSSLEVGSTTNTAGVGRNQHEQRSSEHHPRDNGNIVALPRNRGINASHSVSGAEATVEVLKKPSRAFGALLGNASTKRKFDSGKKEQDEMKVEQIKSSVNLPFHSFLGGGGVEVSQPVEKEAAKPTSENSAHVVVAAAAGRSGGGVGVDGGGEPTKSDTNVQEIILLGSSSDSSDVEELLVVNGQVEDDDEEEESSKNNKEEGETGSLSDLSSSLEKCFQSTPAAPELKPFDYEAARKEVRFGERNDGEDGSGNNNGNNSSSRLDRKNRKTPEGGGEESGDFQQGRRRQAFPASGNRSATFRR